MWSELSAVTLWFTTVALASSADASPSVDMNYIESLPSADTPAFFDTWSHCIGYASARLMVGELLESLSRWKEAIVWAQAELEVSELGKGLPSMILVCACFVPQEPNEVRFPNAPTKIRTGRVSGLARH